MSMEKKESGDRIIVVHKGEVEVEEYYSDDPTYYWTYGSGRMILSVLAICFVVIVAMLLNKARAHVLVNMNNKLNELYANAEMYESETSNTDETSEVIEYKSVITDEIKNEAVKNNVTVEEQVENNYNGGLAKIIISTIIIVGIMAFLSIASDLS